MSGHALAVAEPDPALPSECRRTLVAGGVVLVCWSVALAVSFAPDSAGGIAAAATVFLALGVVVARAGPRPFVVAATLSAAGAIAIALSVLFAHPARSAAQDATPTDGRMIEVEGTVVGKVEPRQAGVRFDAVISRLIVGDEHVAVSVSITVTSGKIPGLDVGAAFVSRGSAAAAYPGDRATFTLRASETTITRAPVGILAVASFLRAALLERVTGLPGPGAELLPGLATGDTSLVSTDLDEAMKVSSLAHLTAVSGANCALVVVGGTMLATALGARRATRLVTAGIALVAFVILVSPEPSVIRAAFMAITALVGLALGRPGGGIGILAVAIVTLLILDPWIASEVGFALSAAATAALLLLTGPLTQSLQRVVPPVLALALAVPLAAQLACTPILALVSDQVSVLGVLANVIAGPAAPAATVIGLFACLAAPLPLLADLLAWVALLPATWIGVTARLASALPGSSAMWVKGPVGVLTLSLLSATLLVALLTRGRIRRVASAVLTLVLAAAIGMGPISTAIERSRMPADWDLAMCDVGQGDAHVLRSGEAVMLIDTGPDPEPLRECLRTLGVERIDVLVLTHFDIDHAGGLDAVSGRVETVLHGPPDADAERDLEQLRMRGARTQQVYRGERGVFGDAAYLVLWPSTDADPGNSASVALDVSGPGFPHALYLGDVGEEEQRRLQDAPPYDVVKVAHHGSADQDHELYVAARPAIALVPVGVNDYGHPREEILSTVRSGGAAIARTDTDGLVLVALDESGDLSPLARPSAVADTGMASHHVHRAPVGFPRHAHDARRCFGEITS